jgi:hypothetical protein
VFLYIPHILLVQSLYLIIHKPKVTMKIEIEFKTASSNASELSQKISPILNAVKQQGLVESRSDQKSLFNLRDTSYQPLSYDR